MPTAASRRLENRRPPPPAWARQGTRTPPSLAQFVLLSLLLHALFILLFGSPAGGSRDGAAMWGALHVTIRGPLREARVESRPDAAPRAPLPGDELLQRRREAKQAEQPPAPERPPQPDPRALRAVDLPPVPPALLETPVRPEATELVPAPRLERIQPVKRDVPVVSAPALDWTPRTLPAATELVPVPRVERPQPVVRELPVVSAPSLDWAPRPALEPTMAPAVTLPPVVRAPVVLPDSATPLLPSTAVPAISPALEPAAKIAPPAVRQAPAAASPATAPATAGDRPVSRARDAGPQPGGSTRDSPIFDNRKAPAAETGAPGGAPRIDLDRARERAREVAREGSGNRALLPFPMPPAPEKKSREQLAIEKALKPECKSAYKDLGLLAVVPLIANEFGEGNCRW